MSLKNLESVFKNLHSRLAQGVGNFDSLPVFGGTTDTFPSQPPHPDEFSQLDNIQSSYQPLIDTSTTNLALEIMNGGFIPTTFGTPIFTPGSTPILDSFDAFTFFSGGPQTTMDNTIFGSAGETGLETTSVQYYDNPTFGQGNSPILDSFDAFTGLINNPLAVSVHFSKNPMDDSNQSIFEKTFPVTTSAPTAVSVDYYSSTVSFLPGNIPTLDSFDAFLDLINQPHSSGGTPSVHFSQKPMDDRNQSIFDLEYPTSDETPGALYRDMFDATVSFVPGTVPTLDTLLRDPDFEPDQPNNVLLYRRFVKDLNSTNQPYKAQHFDPRHYTYGGPPKPGTDYQNTLKTFRSADRPALVTDYSTAGNGNGFQAESTAIGFEPIHKNIFSLDIPNIVPPPGSGNAAFYMGSQFFNGESGDQSNSFNLSYENLYNSDHTIKPNIGREAGGAGWPFGTNNVPTHNAVFPQEYPIVDRTNLNMTSRDTGLIGLAAGSSRGDEPYIVTNIGGGYNNVDNTANEVAISAGAAAIAVDVFTDGMSSLTNYLTTLGSDFVFSSVAGPAGSRENPGDRIELDTIRISRFLTSDRGIEFIAKQNLLGLQSSHTYLNKDGDLAHGTQRFKAFYNPLSTLIATHERAGTSPTGMYDRTQPDLSLSQEYGTLGDNISFKLGDTFTAGRLGDATDADGGDFRAQLNQAWNDLKSDLIPGGESVKKERSSGGDKITILQKFFISAEDKLGRAYNVNALQTVNQYDTESEKDGMPLYFKDLRDNTYIMFRAYLDSLTENISPTWAAHNYIGRSEPVFTYERAERTIDFSFKVAANTEDELTAIYDKLNRLSSLCYPQYVDYNPNNMLKSPKNRMKPPLTKFRLGDMYGRRDHEILGFIASINYSVDQSSTWETKPGRRVARYLIVTISYRVMHERVPEMRSVFFSPDGVDVRSSVLEIPATKDQPANLSGYLLPYGQPGSISNPHLGTDKEWWEKEYQDALLSHYQKMGSQHGGFRIP